MGSPLLRFCFRFFSQCCPRPSNACGLLKARYRDFVWINVYRPFDPIGGSLGDKALGVIQDVNTRQFARILGPAHTNYWNDCHVGRIVAAELRRRDHQQVPDRSRCEQLSWFGQQSLSRTSKVVLERSWNIRVLAWMVVVAGNILVLNPIASRQAFSEAKRKISMLLRL